MCACPTVQRFFFSQQATRMDSPLSKRKTWVLLLLRTLIYLSAGRHSSARKLGSLASSPISTFTGSTGDIKGQAGDGTKVLVRVRGFGSAVCLTTSHGSKWCWTFSTQVPTWRKVGAVKHVYVMVAVQGTALITTVRTGTKEVHGMRPSALQTRRNLFQLKHSNAMSSLRSWKHHSLV